MPIIHQRQLSTSSDYLFSTSATTMGIVESRLLAENVLFACDKATEEGNNRIDTSQFWKDTENIKAWKTVSKHIPQRFRQTRQSAIQKTIARSSKEFQIPQAVQDLQEKRASLFSISLQERGHESENDSSSTHQITSLTCHVPNSPQNCPLSDFYQLLVLCENEQRLGRIRLRICYVVFYRLKNAIKPGTQYQYDEISISIAHLIRESGCKDQIHDIERRVRLWVGLGERYSLIANDLGGLGILYILPEDGGESIWTKELPKSVNNPKRVAMLKNLREKGLPEQAHIRGLHTLAEEETAKILGPIQVSLHRVLENQLSQANTNGDRQYSPNSPQLDISRCHQRDAGMTCTKSDQFWEPVFPIWSTISYA
ncbi:hypothetical protein N7495_007414 [Penicillium taxi]|uniref:uncharacterized protein n=1 Tax=Penicillium taxi TaxID=168475 RepID=UPI00254561A5|nr:uncharacterized protein N7495_007414 [Penicillium taxi]KAJ5887373.1 hypothetical protein N7495_007414 [Penicillium taxi]